MDGLAQTSRRVEVIRNIVCGGSALWSYFCPITSTCRSVCSSPFRGFSSVAVVFVFLEVVGRNTCGRASLVRGACNSRSAVWFFFFFFPCHCVFAVCLGSVEVVASHLALSVCCVEVSGYDLCTVVCYVLCLAV